MSTRETYRNTLAHAVNVVGDERQLAARLGVSVPQIENWLNDVEEIPDGVFLLMVDLVASANSPAVRPPLPARKGPPG
jgi:DNA-binding transcriptional regulator YdaS (Cro superfamily)